MIPVNLALSRSATSTNSLTNNFEIPQSGNCARYLTFKDSAIVTGFEMRRRVRKRHKTREVFDEWGAWTTWTETLAARSGGLRLSQTAISMSSADVSPANFDLAEWEFQVRETDAEWSESLFARAYFAPTITLALSLPDVSNLQLAFSSSWLRNDNAIIIEDILIGSATGLNALPSLLSTPGKKIELNNLLANGSGNISVYNLKRHPINNEILTFVYRFATCDATLENLRYAPLRLTYAAANTPNLSLVPYPDEGYVQITVTDSGGSKPITSACVLMLNGMGNMDLIPVKLGVPTYHRVPPLDVAITYQAIALGAGGVRTTQNKIVEVASEGCLWMNWGDTYEHSVALSASIAWRGSFSRKRTYFETFSGYPKVFNGKGLSSRHSIKSDVIYPRSREDFESLANSTQAVYREPYGARRAVSVDSVDLDDSAENIQTTVSIELTEVPGI